MLLPSTTRWILGRKTIPGPSARWSYAGGMTRFRRRYRTTSGTAAQTPGPPLDAVCAVKHVPPHTAEERRPPAEETLMTTIHAEAATLADSQSDQFDRFLQEATALDPPADSAIGRNRLYGLYTSWCFLSAAAPLAEGEFWAAMKQKGIRPGHARLRMTGPAAADYILSTYPEMV